MLIHRFIVSASDNRFGSPDSMPGVVRDLMLIRACSRILRQPGPSANLIEGVGGRFSDLLPQCRDLREHIRCQ
jgi:hypothetical protein